MYNCICSMIVSFLQPEKPWYLDKCKIGVAIRDKELKLPDKYTEPECFDAVRKQYPDANGVSMNNPCGNPRGYPKKCNCYAMFGMKGWYGGKLQGWKAYKTCRFNDKRKYISARTIA